MSTISKDKYAGGADLTDEAGLAQDLQEIADDLATVRDLATGASVSNAVVTGLTGSAPSTPSTQASGTGATAWRANLAAGIVIVDGDEKAESAQNDFAIHGTTCLLLPSQEVIARIVEKNVTGTLTTVAVKGTAVASTVGATAPTDAEVDADAGVSDVPWVELCRIKLARNATTTLTATYDHSHRGAPASVAGALSTVRGS